MKNQYTADIGDFGKYLLLNYLCYTDDAMENTDYTLGVNWYLTEDANNNDGKHIDYLLNDKSNLRSCLHPFSEHVYDKMKKIVNTERKVSRVEVMNVLPSNTIFYSPLRNVKNREEWVKESIEALHGCDLVFLDPDNGIVNSKKNNMGSVHVQELAKYYNELEANLVIYFHHLRFAGDVMKNVTDIIVPILKELDPDIRFRILVYRKQSTRMYIVINKLLDINLYLKLDCFIDNIDKSIFYEIPQEPSSYNTNHVIEEDDVIVIEDFPAGDNRELILARKKAGRYDRETPEINYNEMVQFQLDLEFNQLEYTRMTYGFIPQSMEDRWFIYKNDKKLFFHRSQTRLCVCIIEIGREDNKYRVVNAWRSTVEGPADDAEAAEMITNVINNILLSKY